MTQFNGLDWSLLIVGYNCSHVRCLNGIFDYGEKWK
jgi:hypothetical protein